jgi:hypothetical protein
LAILFAVVAAPASAATVRFAYTGAEQVFTVPTEVRSVHVTAVGGQGGAGSGSHAGGLGVQVTTDLAVTPGEKLYVEVGGDGTAGGPSVFGGGGAAGADPVGGQPGGAGGGATEIRRLPQSAPGADAMRIVVAGGGGGGGGGPNGRQGGDADEDGEGCVGCAAIGGEGWAGTTAAGGLGGDPAGSGATAGADGQLGSGGAGGARGGGGGGGGYYGGGGGGGGDTTALGGGGGGGGGASFVAGGAAATFYRTGVPSSVSFTYGDATARVTAVAFAPQRVTTVGERAVTIVNRGTIPLSVTGTTISGAQPGDFQAGPGCSAPVPPDASCQIVVRFAPRASGYRDARLTILSNANPATTSLHGLGLAAPTPTLTALHISPSTFKAGGRALVSYHADVAGMIKFRVLRVKRSVRGGKQRTRLIPVGASFSRPARAGVNHFRFKVPTKLPPGRYRLRATGSGPSRSVSAGFRIAHS